MLKISVRLDPRSRCVDLLQAALKILLMLGMLFLQQVPVGALPKTTSGLGAITGRVETLTTMGLARDLQVVLLSPQWADLWNGEVQKRLDIYFDRYRQFRERRTDFADQVSGLAQRDAISFVINSMQSDLGEEFQKFIKKVSPEVKLGQVGK